MPAIASPDYPFEIFKGFVQLLAVTAGVFAGFALNSRFQIRNRLNQARADWAAAAERALGAVGLAASPIPTRVDSPSHGVVVAQNIAQHRNAHESYAHLRAATVQLLLLEPDSGHKTRAREIEAKIVVARGAENVEEALSGIHSEIEELVTKWAAANEDPLFS